MSIDQAIHALATVTLVEMMVTIGLGVTMREVLAVATNPRQLVQATIANYVIAPAAAVLLLLAFRASPMVAAGILIPAVCPGAPYGPPFTAMAGGNVGLSVGLMALLAASSALVAPLLLGALLPLVVGAEAPRISVGTMVFTLAMIQFLPLCAGLYVAERHTALARRLKTPMARLSTALNLATLGLILIAQFHLLAAIRWAGYLGMLALLASTVLAGWLLGGTCAENRKALTMATSVRNVGLSLVVVTASFAGTPAVTAATAYGLLQTVLMALVALAWGRRVSDSATPPVAERAAL